MASHRLGIGGKLFFEDGAATAYPEVRFSRGVSARGKALHVGDPFHV
jgi:hypothetical protein